MPVKYMKNIGIFVHFIMIFYSLLFKYALICLLHGRNTKVSFTLGSDWL